MVKIVEGLESLSGLSVPRTKRSRIPSLCLFTTDTLM